MYVLLCSDDDPCLYYIYTLKMTDGIKNVYVQIETILINRHKVKNQDYYICSC